jgi:hypothetical protein
VTDQKPTRFAALRARARANIEARRQTTEGLAQVAPMLDAEHADDAAPNHDFEHDAAFEARLFAEIVEWLEHDDQLKTVTIDDLLQLGGTDGAR